MAPRVIARAEVVATLERLARPERVLVIDDDLGKSGASVEGRTGFRRLVSEVSLDHGDHFKAGAALPYSFPV